ncbi:MAG: MaoC/PaaZ C-terminal domain-containing protein [Desulfobacteraceae bacterium]|jgi:acyl dehydratase
MALDLEIIGKRVGPFPFTYNEDTAILYALGIGAGINELNFIYEKDLKVFPTFVVVPFAPTFLSHFVPEARLNLSALLHGEHKIVLHEPVPTSGTVHITAICDSIYDKADNGAILNVRLEANNEAGDLVFENMAMVMDRSAGNFGGERGAKSKEFHPPEGRGADFQMEYTTSPEQAALYRLSGDKNPVHIDPDFAKKGGFDGPILQGLCTFGFAGRALLHSVCGSDPSRLKSLSVRFMGIVFPGDSLITEGWKVDQGVYVFRTKTQDHRLVLGNAVAEVVE